MDRVTPLNSSRPDGAALLGKACDVLEAVAAAPGGIGQAELAIRLGLSRTTLYRILGALVARGLLRQDPSRRVYAVGFRLLEMAQGVTRSLGDGSWAAPDLPAVAAPEIRHLRDITGETTYVAVLQGREVIALGKFEGAHEVRSASRLGQAKPLHCTSQGKAILAFLPEAEREDLLRRLPMKALTPYTITDRRRLAAELRIVAARGYATDDQEIVPEVRCVGAPILDAEGRVHGAISVAGPKWRMTLERLELLGPEVAAAARRIGAGLRPPPRAPNSTAVAQPGPAAFRGSSPRWASGRLWWTDNLAPEIRIATGGEDRRVARWDAPLRALAPASDGTAIVVDETATAARVAPDGTVVSRATLPALSHLRALRTRPDGVLWGSAEAEGGSVVGPVAADGHVRQVWRLPGEVRAMAWGPDGTLYASALREGTIHRLDEGRPAPLLLARFPAGGGRPAGLAVDAAGGVWTALRDGWSVARLAEDGEVDQVLPLPVPGPTGLCFGGLDLATLYVTTAREGVPLDTLASAPLSGRLLAFSPGMTGTKDAAADWRAGV
ncbi:IclR family transcriptional regulator C-terminal domain-containing protein [Roseomonas sp. CCTCC AB2023176]|uniref:IclR family transcriptional regulator domain-containing protein n=1 Tax=Roseomonas sp. CCTCC AB2023176 TaxID=3342640 RepID=UPI0035D993CF